MVSIIRKSIADLSTFDRQRKKNKSNPTLPISKPNEPANPWTEDQGSTSPPPLDALFNRKNRSEFKRTCFKCEKEGCLLGKFPGPINLRRISDNLVKFKKAKAEKTNNAKWNSKKVYSTELQPSPEEWPDV